MSDLTLADGARRRRNCRRSRYDVTSTTVVLGAIAAATGGRCTTTTTSPPNATARSDIFLNTPNQAAWFERYITDWTGPKGRLGRMTFRMKGSVFPGDTMELRATVRKVDTDDVGCGWVDLDVTLNVGDTVATDVHGPRRGARRRRRQPLDPARRRLASVAARTTQRRGTMDLDFTDEQEMLRETVRGVCEKHASLDRRARGRGRSDRLPRVVLDAAGRPRAARAHDREKPTAAPACRCSTPRSSTRSSAGRWRRRRTSSARCCAAACSNAPGSDEQRHEWLPKIAAGTRS